MPDKQQPEPLRIAALLEKTGAQGSLRDQAAVELRRQHVELETLRTGYAAARLEIESLQLQLTDQGRVLEKVMHELVQTHRSTRGEPTTTYARTQQDMAYAALPDEQVAFERHYRHLDLSRERDAWGNLRYTHDAVSLAWESWQVRASHGQAPAMPECLTCNDHGAVGNILTAEPCQDCTRKAAPAAAAGPVAVLKFERGTPGRQNEMPRVVSCNWMPDGEYEVYLAAAPTTTSQAAASVLEDAARYHYLRNKSQVVHNKAWFGGMPVRNHYGDFLCRDDALAALDTAIDAARKQGANHD